MLQFNAACSFVFCAAMHVHCSEVRLDTKPAALIAGQAGDPLALVVNMLPGVQMGSI